MMNHETSLIFEQNVLFNDVLGTSNIVLDHLNILKLFLGLLWCKKCLEPLKIYRIYSTLLVPFWYPTPPYWYPTIQLHRLFW